MNRDMKERADLPLFSGASNMVLMNDSPFFVPEVPSSARMSSASCWDNSWYKLRSIHWRTLPSFFKTTFPGWMSECIK